MSFNTFIMVWLSEMHFLLRLSSKSITEQQQNSRDWFSHSLPAASSKDKWILGTDKVSSKHQTIFQWPPIDCMSHRHTFRFSSISHGTLMFCYSRSTEKYKKMKSKLSGLVKPTAKEPCLCNSPQQAALLHFIFLHYCIYLVKVSPQSSFTQVIAFFPHGCYFPSFALFQHWKFAGKSPITHAFLCILFTDYFLCENVNFPKELR